ncbi:hypothetical protein MTO96_046775, partial [Rhipicephalus appendiculatus]
DAYDDFIDTYDDFIDKCDNASCAHDDAIYNNGSCNRHHDAYYYSQRYTNTFDNCGHHYHS